MPNLTKLAFHLFNGSDSSKFPHKRRVCFLSGDIDESGINLSQGQARQAKNVKKTV